MRKFFLTFVAFSICLVPVTSFSVPDYEELFRKSETESISDVLYWMSQEERDEMAAFLKKKLATKEWPESGLSDYFLLRLHDPEVRQKLTRKFLTTNAMVDGFGIEPGDEIPFRELGDPEIISDMAWALFEGDPANAGEIRTSDVFFYPLNGAAARVIQDNAAFCRDFEPEVRDWAKELEVNRYPELVSILQEWWKANEQAFRDKKYKEVKPGRKMTKGPEIPSLDSLPRVGPGADLPATPKVAIQPPASSTKEHPWLLPASIAAIVGAGALWVALQRRK